MMIKKRIFNLSASFLAFSLAYSIAHLTEIDLVKNVVLYIFLIQWILFIPAYIFQTEKFYDLAGSCTYIFAVGYVSYNFYLNKGLNIGNILLGLAIMIWAVRLGSFFFLKIKKEGEYKRFRDIKPYPTRWFMTWTLQGMWVSICSACALTAISSKNGVNVDSLFYIGLSIYLIGLIVEIIADNQKSKFRSNPENKNKFISSGLWSISRHPNYVGEIVLWLGISIMSLSTLSGFQFVTLISPVFTYVLLVYISGVRILEINGKKKWGHQKDYQDYIKNTPSLIFK